MLSRQHQHQSQRCGPGNSAVSQRAFLSWLCGSRSDLLSMRYVTDGRIDLPEMTTIMMTRLTLQRALSSNSLAPNGNRATRPPFTFASIAAVTAMMDVAVRNEPARASDGRHHARWITGTIECARHQGLVMALNAVGLSQQQPSSDRLRSSFVVAPLIFSLDEERCGRFIERALSVVLHRHCGTIPLYLGGAGGRPPLRCGASRDLWRPGP